MILSTKGSNQKLKSIKSIQLSFIWNSLLPESEIDMGRQIWTI